MNKISIEIVSMVCSRLQPTLGAEYFPSCLIFLLQRSDLTCVTIHCSCSLSRKFNLPFTFPWEDEGRSGIKD